MRPSFAHRNHSAYWAFLAHRLSGVGLAVFLPLHFLVLGLAADEAALNGVLNWTQAPLVRVSEAVLLAGLAVHLTGGLRLLALEFLPWREGQTIRIAAVFAIGVAAGLGKLLW